MGAAWRIAAKDIRLRARDRSLFIIAFVAPLLLSFIFDTVFGDFGEDETITFDVGIVDLDGGSVAAGFVAMFEGVEQAGFFDLSRLDDEAAARDAVDDGDVDAAVVLPQGLSDAVQHGASTRVDVIGDIDNELVASIVSSVAQSYATAVDTGGLAAAVAVAGGVVDPGRAGDVAAEVAMAGPLATLVDHAVESEVLDLTTQMVAGLSLFFVFFIAGLSVTGVLEERDHGTLRRLLAAPVPRWSILTGKALAAILIGIVALWLLMGASTFLMGANWGNPIGAALLAVAAVLAAAGIMALVGGLAETAEQAGNLQSIVAVTLAMLGGSFVPIDPGSGSLLTELSLLTPNAWYLRGLGKLGAGGVADALPAIGVLLAFAVVTGTGAALLARKELRT